MELWNVYQPTIDNDRYHEVNAVGWDNTEWGKSYLKITAFPDEKDAIAMMRDAVEHELFLHNWIVKADNNEHVFILTNGMGNPDNVIWCGPRRKSGSVGDIIIRADSKQGFICLPFGWHPIPEEEIKWFETKVVTRMRVAVNEGL